MLCFLQYSSIFPTVFPHKISYSFPARNRNMSSKLLHQDLYLLTNKQHDCEYTIRWMFTSDASMYNSMCTCMSAIHGNAQTTSYFNISKWLLALAMATIEERTHKRDPRKSCYVYIGSMASFVLTLFNLYMFSVLPC